MRTWTVLTIELIWNDASWKIQSMILIEDGGTGWKIRGEATLQLWKKKSNENGNTYCKQEDFIAVSSKHKFRSQQRSPSSSLAPWWIELLRGMKPGPRPSDREDAAGRLSGLAPDDIPLNKTIVRRKMEEEEDRSRLFFLLLSYTSCGQQQMMLPCGSQAMASSPQAIPFLAELSFFAAFTLHLAFPAQVHQQILHCLHITTRCLQCQKEIYVKGLTDERFSHRRAFEHGHTHLISGTSQSWVIYAQPWWLCKNLAPRFRE